MKTDPIRPIVSSMIVIADSGSLRYLIVIEQIRLLPLLYGNIIIPLSFVNELTQPATPRQCVSGWTTCPNG